MARPRRSENTRLKLLDEGVAAFIEQGYHGTGLKEVLDKVKVPKGSFYNYFASKEDFGAQVVRHYSEGLANQLDQALATANSDALSALKKFFRQMIRGFEEKEFRLGCLVGNLGGELEDSAVCRQAMNDALLGLRNRFRNALLLAQEQGTVRDDISAVELADLLLNAWEGSLIRMKIDRSVKPLKQFIKLIIDDFLRA